MISFPPYRLDLEDERLWHGTKLLALRRKPFAILRYLATHPKRLVTHEELLAEIWGGAVVSESAVRSHLHDLRHALGDGVIETVVGRGYRFVAELAVDQVAVTPAVARPDRVVVGREPELAVLRAAFERAATGHRQVCFVSGEPGIGKTTLVDTFFDELEDRGLAVRGHCVEQFGTPEAYLAMIEVIARLRRSARGDQILAALARYAPTFLAKLPHLVPDALHADLARRAQGGSEATIMRELAEALEAACSDDPIVIVLEDLQWSDLATIDLLALLAQRTERAKLLVVGTARRAALQTAEHPLHRVAKSLIARHGAVAIALERIATTSVRELVARRFPDHAFPDTLVEVIASITGGTPLFLVTLIDDLVRRGMIAERAGRWELTVSVDDVAAHRPDSIKQLIDIQLDRLTPDEQRTLEVASLVGAVFATGPVAAALGVAIDAIDDRCDELARRGLFLRREASEDGPDGAPRARYAFTHALVQEVCDERSSPAKRQRWHLAIAEHLERAYAANPADIAGVLAIHFEKAGLAARAIDHYVTAGHQTALRFASLDAVTLFERARALVLRVPRTRQRDALELELLAIVGQLMIRTPYSGGDPLHVYERARELAHEIGDVANAYAALANLCLRRAIHAELDLADQLGKELLALEATETLDPMLVEYGACVRGFLATYRGEVEAALAIFEPLAADVQRSNSVDRIIHPTSMLGRMVRGAVSNAYVGIATVFLGAPERALGAARRAIVDAHTAGDRIALGIAENMLVRIHVERRDPLPVIEAAARVVVDRATAGWVVLEESRSVVAWIEAHRTPISAAAATATLDAYRARLTKVSLGAPNAATTIAATLWVSGHHAEARTLVELAIEYALQRHELLFLPDLVRARGDYAVEADVRLAAYRDAHERALTLDIPLAQLRAAIALRDRALVAAALARCREPDAETPDFVSARAIR